MPIYHAKHIIGRTITPSQHIQAPLVEPKEEVKEMSGGTLEGMSSKLEKLIVKPKKKHQNIKFNPK